MFIIEPKQTIKSLAFVSGLISIAFLLTLIGIRIHITLTGNAPNWVGSLYSRHYWSHDIIPPVSSSTNLLFIFSILLFHGFVLAKIVLAIYLWRAIPKDVLSTDIKSLNKWLLCTIISNLSGLVFLFLLDHSGALEYMLARIFLMMTGFIDLISILVVIWTRGILRANRISRTVLPPCYFDYDEPYPNAGEFQHGQPPTTVQAGRATIIGGPYIIHDVRYGHGQNHYNPNHNLRPNRCSIT